MALLAPLCRMANTFKCPCSASPPADPKLVSEDTKKCQSLNSLLALPKLHTQVDIFGFTFLDLLIKMMKIRLLYILYCPPTPNMWLQGSFNPWPSCIDWFAAPPSPILRSYWLAHRPIARSHFLPPEGEGEEQYNISTCGMAEGTQNPCISHIDASHGVWPRIESSLLFCIFFYIVKIIEKMWGLRIMHALWLNGI